MIRRFVGRRADQPGAENARTTAWHRKQSDRGPQDRKSSTSICDGDLAPQHGDSCQRCLRNVDVCRGSLARSITNIGNKPTFGGDSDVTVESHVMDFDRELYGEKIQVRFASAAGRKSSNRLMRYGRRSIKIIFGRSATFEWKASGATASSIAPEVRRAICDSVCLVTTRYPENHKIAHMIIIRRLRNCE